VFKRDASTPPNPQVRLVVFLSNTSLSNPTNGAYQSSVKVKIERNSGGADLEDIKYQPDITTVLTFLLTFTGTTYSALRVVSATCSELCLDSEHLLCKNIVSYAMVRRKGLHLRTVLRRLCRDASGLAFSVDVPRLKNKEYEGKASTISSCK
jgi:hypothetical protein